MYPQYILHLSSKNLSIVHLSSLHPHSILSRPPSIFNTFYIYSQTSSIYPLATRLSFVYPYFTLHLFLITYLYSIYSQYILHLSSAHRLQSSMHPPSILPQHVRPSSILIAPSIYFLTTRLSFIYSQYILDLSSILPPSILNTLP